MTATEEGGATHLERLAGHYGVEVVWEDAQGRTRRVGPETLVRILHAMHVEVSSEEEAAERLAEAEAAEWARALPPVHVDRSGGRMVEVPVNLPAGVRRLAWRVHLEEGGERHGEADVARMPRIETRYAGGEAQERRALRLPALPPGYHRLNLAEPLAEMPLIVAPRACWQPPEMRASQRLFGISAQLYLVRSQADWGIGDFDDLARLVRFAAGEGAEVVGLNPLHALFMDAPEAASPYSPASRLLLNPLAISIEALPPGPRLDAFRRDPGTRRRIEAVREAKLVDYTGVVALKAEALAAAFADFLDDADEERRRALADFVEARGPGFARACLFLALRARFAAGDPPRPDWRTWPEGFRAPDGEGTLDYLADEGDEVLFQHYVQFVADGQLEAAAAEARRAGMSIGLYRDLAVGADAAGAETWASPEAVSRGVAVGAPPDIFVPGGQSWGLPPFQPHALRAEAYESFVELVRANMRHAGGIRIDHVMGLQHLWWVPDDTSPAEGAYVGYPLDDLVGILALESVRQHCLVVGEDLGTVPAGFREAMAEAGILSYRVLFFEQDFDVGVFRAAAEYPRQAMAVCGSHDLPTLRGWWLGVDNDLKEDLGLFPDAAETAAQRERRARDRESFVGLLRADGLLPEEGEVDEEAFVAAANAFLAETASAIAMVQLDDLTGEPDQVNVPSTLDEQHPNWRRRYRLTLEEIERDPRIRELLEVAACRARNAAPKRAD